MNKLVFTDPFRSIHQQSLIGFDELFDKIKQLDKPQTGFPPYNIVQDGSLTKIIMAVAGYSKENISVVLEDSKLYISGKYKSGNTESLEYIYKGIAERDFKRVFTLSDSIEVDKVVLLNGLLEVTLTQIIPEQKEQKVFPIQ